jgi:hypothetical protein
MKATNEFSRLLDDLAGHWTEPALEILKAANVRHVSVETELVAWHALREVLGSEFRRQQAFSFSAFVSLGALREQVLRKATPLVTQRLGTQRITGEFENHIRRSVGGRTATAAERRLHAEIVGQPVTRASLKPLRRTDVMAGSRMVSVRG